MFLDVFPKRKKNTSRNTRQNLDIYFLHRKHLIIVDDVREGPSTTEINYWNRRVSLYVTISIRFRRRPINISSGTKRMKNGVQIRWDLRECQLTFYHGSGQWVNPTEVFGTSFLASYLNFFPRINKILLCINWWRLWMFSRNFLLIVIYVSS